MKLFYTFLIASLSFITQGINSNPPTKSRREVPTFPDEKPFVGPEYLPIIGAPEDFTSKLKKQLADQSKRLAELQTILTSLKEDRSKSVDLQSRTQAELDAKEAEAKKLVASAKELEAENARLKDQLKAATEKNSTRASEDEDLQALKEGLETKESAIKTFQEVIAAQKAALEKAQADLGAARQNDSIAQETPSDLDADGNNLDDKLEKKALEVANARMQEQLQKIFDILKITNAQADQIPAELRQLQSAADEARTTAERAITQYAEQLELTKKLETELAIHANAAAELAKLQSSAAPTQKELAETKQQLAKIQEDAVASKKAFDEKVAELASLQASIDKIKDSSETPAKQLKAKLVVLQQLVSSQLPTILNKLLQLQEQVKTLAEELKQHKESDKELLKIDSYLTGLQNSLKQYMDRAQSTPTVGTSTKDTKRISSLTAENTAYQAELQKLLAINADLTDQFNRMSQELAFTQDKERSEEKTAALTETQKAIDELKERSAAELAAVKEETARKLAAIEDKRREDQLIDMKFRVLEGQNSTNLRITDRTSSLSADASQVGLMAVASGSRGVSTSAPTVVDWRQSTIPRSNQQQMIVPQQYRQATSMLTNSPFNQVVNVDNIASTVAKTTQMIAQYNSFIQNSLLKPPNDTAFKIYWNALLSSIWKHADIIYKYGQPPKHGQPNPQRARHAIMRLDELTAGTYNQLKSIASRNTITLDPPLNGTDAVTGKQGIFSIIAGYKKTLLEIASIRVPARGM
jgi:chromosome segregation ATPase